MIDLATTALTTLRIAQMDSGIDVDVSLGGGLAGGAVGAFLTTLVVAAIMIAVVPEYTEERMAAVLDDPVGSFVYGIACLLGLFLVIFLLVITIVGIFVAAPLAFVAYVVWAVGAAIAYLAIADRLVGHEDGWLKPILLGAAINGVLAATGVGGLISICIGAAGFGTVLESWLG